MFLRFFIALILGIFSLLDVQAEESDLLVLEENQTFTGNFFAGRSNVQISGVVKGDAYVAAAQCSVDGIIDGDLIIGCASVDISGRVTGNVRALAGQIIVSGIVDKNISVIAGNIQIDPLAKINGSVVVMGSNVDMSGRIASDVTILGSHAKVGGEIGGDVDAYINELRISSKAKIIGDVIYKSSNIALIDPKAQIKGKINYHQTVLSNIIDWSWLKGLVLGSKLLVVLMNFAFTFVFGWIVIKLFPSQVSMSTKMLNDKLVNSFGVGIVALVLAPLLSIVLLVTVIGAPFALALIALNIFSFYTAKIFFVIWMTGRMFPKLVKKKGKLLMFALGLSVYYICTMLPYIGTLIAFVSMLLGVGAVVLAQSERSNSIANKS